MSRHRPANRRETTRRDEVTLAERQPCALCLPRENANGENRAVLWVHFVRLYWARHPRAYGLFTLLPVILLAMSLVLASHPTYEYYAALPLLLLVVRTSLAEFAPLSPLPVTNSNAVAAESFFIFLLELVFNIVLATLFYALLIELVFPTDLSSTIRRIALVLFLGTPVIILGCLLTRIGWKRFQRGQDDFMRAPSV